MFVNLAPKPFRPPVTTEPFPAKRYLSCCCRQSSCRIAAGQRSWKGYRHCIRGESRQEYHLHHYKLKSYLSSYRQTPLSWSSLDTAAYCPQHSQGSRRISWLALDSSMEKTISRIHILHFCTASISTFHQTATSSEQRSEQTRLVSSISTLSLL